MVHSREATADTLEILRKFPQVRGELHCFSGSAETARELVKMGFYICLLYTSIFEELKGCRLQPKDVRFIHSYVTSEPARVLLSAMKDGGEGLRILPPLIVHERDGSETEEVRRIYCRDVQQTGDGNGTG